MELSRQAIVDRISGKITSIEDFNFDNLVAPPLSALLSPYDIDCLYSIATSVKYSGNPKKKYQAIDQIMRSRGFVKLSAGTNRVVYRHLESNSFVVKVAADAIGIKDNPREFQNQFIFKPFVTKVFEVSPCGTVGVFEKVNPIESREEFLSVADDIYDVINEWFIGKYIMADIGTKFFMNWGIRTYNVGKEGSVAFGPVLLDFPYVYELDGNKLFCSAVDKNNLETGVCGGVIDYDSGFNFLHCTKCGVRYRVKELAKKIKNNEIRIDRRRETNKMKVGHYDENGNVVFDEDVVDKAEEKKVNLRSNAGVKPSGTLTVDMSMFSGQVKPEKKEKKPAKNNSLRSSSANSRGMVKAPVASDIKVDLNPAKDVDNNKEFDKLVEYNAEDDIVVLSNGDKEITAKISKIIPKDYLQVAIESSAEYTEMLSVLNKNKELEAELDTIKTNSDKNFEEFADEKEKYEKLLAEKDSEIEGFKASIDTLSKASNDFNEKASKRLKEKDEEIAKLKKQLATEPEPETSDSEMTTVDNTTNHMIEELKRQLDDKDAIIKNLSEGSSKRFIPIDRNPNFNIDAYDEKYDNYRDDIIVIHGVVENLNGFTRITDGTLEYGIVFPVDEEAGEYYNSEDKVIVVVSINGYSVNELLSAVESIDTKESVDEEEKSDEKSEE